MKIDNEMTIIFKAKSVNEAFARSAVAAFTMQLDPTIEEMNDIKTAVSEAVTNCIVHAYRDEDQDIKINCKLCGDVIHITVTDNGKGIEDIQKARQPFYTSRPEDERSGMGFTVMETFMDTLEVFSNIPKGVVVEMSKKIGKSNT